MAAMGRAVMMRISVRDEENKIRITVEGELAGDLAKVLEENWRRAAALHREKAKIVDLRGITFVDAAGRGVLGLMVSDGAEFAVSGPKTAYLIETLRTECKRRRVAGEAGRLTVIGAILLLVLTLIAVATGRTNLRSLLLLNANSPQIVRSVL
jgi:anti-anti-sigma regulatory factor